MFVVSTRIGVLDLSLQTPNPPKGQNHVILDPDQILEALVTQTVSETLVSLSPKP